MTTKPESLHFTDAATDPKSVGNAIRAVIAGSAATKVIGASVSLFEAGGKLVLDEGSRNVLRTAAERGAEKALAIAAGPLLGPATAFAKRPVALLAQGAKASKAIAPLAAKAAGREILKGAGRAAGIGFVIDGAVAGVEAASAMRSGTMDGKKAATYVAKEATTGAIATGTGMLLAAGLVAVTGGIAAPVVFAVGALGSIGTKQLLRRLTNRAEKVEVREVAAIADAPIA